MRELWLGRFFKTALAWASCLMFLVATSFAQTEQQSVILSSRSANTLRTFLQGYLKRPSLGIDKTTRYIAAFVDLKGDGKQEIIVYVTGRWWCGSGGCQTLILSPAGSSYRVVTKILITRPPIRVLTNASHGWRSIGVWVQGGGIQPGYEAELRFDGKTYPISPANPPALPLTGKVAGDVVVPSTQEGTLLYP
jgi:hypothetical protein